jgi:MarR family transcriptional regulator, lower aerobic nicotinate degradation pathway regulator
MMIAMEVVMAEQTPPDFRPEIMRLKPEDVPPFLMERTTYLLHRTGMGMVHKFEEALAPLRIRVHHYAVLAVLSLGRPASQIDIASNLRFDRNKMVNIVDELEQLGLARRETNPEDRRAKAVVLTDAGRAALKAAWELERAVEDECLAALTPDQRRQLHELLRCVVTSKRE